MKNTKYLIISLVFLILIVSRPSLAAENEKEEKKTEGIAKQWLKTLVSVEQIPKKGEPKSIGTAFLVVTINRHTILVTAKHVVTDTQGDLKKNLAYRFNQKSGAAKLLSETHIREIRGQANNVLTDAVF
jgi:hypothetical protein